MIERGYSAFSYADISDAVGIRKPSIHHHFPTKAALAVAVLKSHREKTIEGTRQLDREIEDPRKRLHAYVHYWEGCIRARTVPFCVAALMGAELPSLPEEVQAEVRLHFTALSEWLERTLKAGAKSGVLKLQDSAASEAQALMAVVHGAMLSARATGDGDVFRIVTGTALKRLNPAKN
ncbi:TetR/AcrR family transcriptional regulator [Occallatibacter riparius]|uniref:TetR/AcrR family transcriptional regulator n=2 Tax=Occallatibacter riparius TaxID=1002689 RepID=A0A9J7BQL7_9BACT|nr:TetR/AcrR family transcriptional regulator [Occallatibacter riparius]